MFGFVCVCVCVCEGGIVICCYCCSKNVFVLSDKLRQYWTKIRTKKNQKQKSSSATTTTTTTTTTNTSTPCTTTNY